jgi:AcrR family transcriptional regulator
MPKVTEEHIEARRRQILDAALACFSRNGFHQTTINDICEEANLSAGAIYNYFDSKDSMIAECCTHGQTEIGAVFDGAQLLGTAREAIEKLAEVFIMGIASSEAQPASRLEVQLWSETLRNPEVLQTAMGPRSQVLAGLQSIVERGQRNGDVSDSADAEYVARVLMALRDGLVLQQSMDPDTDVSRYVAAMKQVTAGALFTQPPAQSREQASPAILAPDTEAKELPVQQTIMTARR